MGQPEQERSQATPQGAPHPSHADTGRQQPPPWQALLRDTRSVVTGGLLIALLLLFMFYQVIHNAVQRSAATQAATQAQQQALLQCAWLPGADRRHCEQGLGVQASAATASAPRDFLNEKTIASLER
jgi:hypothetical protein